jgi:hypothetical protein
MLCHTSNHWGHRNCEQNFTNISGNNTRTTLNRFFTKTAILGTCHIIRKVLQAETWSLSGGVHHWLKGRITSEERKPPRFYPRGKDPPVPIVQEAGWAPEPVWTQRLEEKPFAPAGDRTPIAQPVVRHYTAWANPAPQLQIVCDVTIVTQQCKQPQNTAMQGWKSFIQLTNLNLNHFKMIKAMGLKIITSRSPLMMSPPYHFSWKSSTWFKSW